MGGFIFEQKTVLSNQILFSFKKKEVIKLFNSIPLSIEHIWAPTVNESVFTTKTAALQLRKVSGMSG